MRIKPEIGSVVGPSDTTHWGQVIVSPAAYGVVELTSSNAQKAGIELLTTLSERLATPPVSLNGIKELTQEVNFEGVETVLLLVPVGSVIYVALAGGGAVYLKRGHATARLLVGAGALSGEVKEGDTLLLCSRGMHQTVSEETLLNVFDHLRAQDVAEKLTLVLHEHGSSTGAAALIFQVAAFIHTEEEVEVPRPAELARSRPMETVWRLPTLAYRKLSRLKFPRRVRSLSVVTILLLILFGVSVVLGIVKKTQTSTSREVQQTLMAATHAFEEGMALMELNSVKGRERLTQAKTILEPLTRSLSERSKDGRTVRDLYTRVVDSLTGALHSVKGDPTLFFDASLVKKGGTIDSLSLFESSLGLLDKINRSIYTLEVASKKSEIVGGGDAISGATHVATYGDKIYVVTNRGVAMVRLSDKKTVPDTIEKSDQWGTIGAVAAFGGNLYLLDTAKSRIWKYVATEKNFSELREYLNPDTLLDLSKATSMAIDGSVWVGTADGKILRFTQGKENTFFPQGVEPGLGNYLVVYTSDVVKNIYILDRDNKRVVVVDKDGFYLAQYVWEGGILPTQIAVSEKEKKILLLAEGKIYALELK